MRTTEMRTIAMLATAFVLGAPPLAAGTVKVRGQATAICASTTQNVHEEAFVSVGAIEQWVTIKGESCANPVILFLHGGLSSRASAVDLTVTPLLSDRAMWTERTSYHATQALAATVREAALDAIRYESVRDPEHAACAAVLSPAAFSRAEPRFQETWFIATSRDRVRCAKDLRRGLSWEFAREQLVGPAT